MDKSFHDLVGTEAPSPRSPRQATISEDVRIYINRSESERDNGKRSWAESDGRFWTTPFSHDSLPSGLYRMALSDNVGPIFVGQSNDTDSLVHFPDSESSKLVNEIVQFKGLKQKFQDNGLLYKRGIMLYGPPGSGKTCTLQFIVKLLISEHNSVAVIIDQPATATVCLQSLRRIEPNRQVIVIMEDLDSLVQRYGESEYLALLDGESQIDNVVFIATTNYPERLDARFVDRPSRFDTIRYIGLPNAESRHYYFQLKLPNADQETIKKYVSLSKNFSIAHLREFLILTICFGVEIEEAGKRLQETIKRKISSTKVPGGPDFGFTSSS